MPAWSQRPGRLATLAAVLAGGALAACTPDTPVTGSLTVAVAVADLNGDGRLDVLGLDSAYAGELTTTGFVSARLQDASTTGRWLDPVRSSACLEPGAVAVADLDGDGHPDVVVTCTSLRSPSFTVEVLRRDPATPGAFLAPIDLPLEGRRPNDVRIADLDGDGQPDLVVAADGGTSLLVSLQARGGGFGTPLPIEVGGEPVALALADLTGAGRIDLVAALRGGQVAVVLHGVAAGTFQAPTLLAAGRELSAVAVADLDGDGHPDLLLTDYSAGQLLVLRQGDAGGGVFTPAVAHDVGNRGALAIAVGDLDGDGRPDVVVASFGPPGLPGSLSVFRQPVAAGVLAAPELYVADGPTSVVIGDVDGDGLPDLVAADGAPIVYRQDPAHAGKFLDPIALRH